MMNRISLVSGFSMFLLAVTAVAEDVTRTFDVAPGGTLDIDTDVGSIEVTPTDGSQVIIEVETEGVDADRLELSFDQRDEGVRVKARLKKAPFSDQHKYKLKAKFRATVPTTYNVRADTSGGNIEVGDVDGRVRADTSGGSILVGKVTGPVRADTAGGSIEVEASEGDVDADTSGGSIRLGAMQGRVRADTSGGSIRIDSSAGPVRAGTAGGSITIRGAREAVDASTAGGSVTVTFVGQPSGDSDLSTSGGNVTAILADGLGFDIRARSGTRVKSKFQLDNAKVDPDRLSGSLNGGGPRLEMSSSGRVSIKKL